MRQDVRYLNPPISLSVRHTMRDLVYRCWRFSMVAYLLLLRTRTYSGRCSEHLEHMWIWLFLARLPRLSWKLVPGTLGVISAQKQRLPTFIVGTAWQPRITA